MSIHGPFPWSHGSECFETTPFTYKYIYTLIKGMSLKNLSPPILNSNCLGAAFGALSPFLSSHLLPLWCSRRVAVA